MVCDQVLRIIEGSYTCIYYSIINFGSNHCRSSLHLNIMNDVSSAILDMDTVSSFTCIFDGFISSDFRTESGKLAARGLADCSELQLPSASAGCG